MVVVRVSLVSERRLGRLAPWEWSPLRIGIRWPWVTVAHDGWIKMTKTRFMSLA
jgi:hypothetical protein